MNIAAIGKKKKRPYRNPSLYFSVKKTRKERSLNYKKGLYYFGFFVLIIILYYVTFHSSFFTLKTIEIHGNKNIEAKKILELVDNQTNIFLLDTELLEKTIIETIPWIKSVTIYKGIPNAIKINIVENEPSIKWITDGKSYLLNDNGFVYAELSQNEGGFDYLPVVIDRGNLPVEIKRKIVSENFVEFINSIYSELFVLTNIKPKQFFVEDTTIDVNLESDTGVIIKFDSLRPSEIQMNNLKLFLIEKKRESYQYIDLRVSGWVYYK